jgi:glycosyltransferase involved in cell wall biosynthesis
MADHHIPDVSDAGLAREVSSETARLAHLVRSLSLSANLQADRADAEAGEAHAWRLEAAMLRASLFWRLTAPARLIIDLARGRTPFGLPLREALARARAIAAEEGWRAVVRRARAWLRRRHPHVGDRVEAPKTRRGASPQAHDLPWCRPPAEPPDRVLAPSVLIIAELTLPQCAKYRVWQKQEHFARLGMGCQVVNWHDTGACRAAASLATAVIFYRVPGFPNVLGLIAECRRLRLPLWWEVDDLIFDEASYLLNRNLAHLDDELRRSILSGVPLYRRAMLECGRGLASTPRLAAAMREAGLTDVAVVENALDDETLCIADRLRSNPRPARSEIVVTYGSGTRTHNADFVVAAPGLLAAMRARPRLMLRIAGDVKLPASFDALGDRVERVPKTHFAAYMERLADSDISIAPLENTIFNDCKSNIKFLEAAALGLVSICSPCDNFRDVVRQGVNGLLANSDREWEAALLALADDPALRQRLGEAARQTALDRYSPAAVAQNQARPLLAGIPARDATPLRVLMANVYFWPRSFGGATIVAEEMARRLHARDDTVVHVVTGAEDLDDADLPPGQALLRYDMPVPGKPAIMIAALRQPGQSAILGFDNPALARHFGGVLDAVRPDVVHLHAIQGLSAAIARSCLERRIPYVITLHDAWWICARQFMVQADGRYCFQKKIDLKICDACMPGAPHLRARYDMLMETLRGAALLLAPSEAHRQLYLAQGLAADLVCVAPNGVRHPASHPVARPLKPDEITFAYVGGNVDVKGFGIVAEVFERLGRSNWRLILVDNTLNLGFSSIDAAAWKVSGRVETVPAYTQDTMDRFFDGIDVLLFPSQWKESFGLTVREALLRGVWVITTDGGGPAEAVHDGVNGTIIPLDGKPDRLQAAVESLLADPRHLSRPLEHTGIIDFAEQAGQLRKHLQEVATKHVLF